MKMLFSVCRFLFCSHQSSYKRCTDIVESTVFNIGQSGTEKCNYLLLAEYRFYFLITYHLRKGSCHVWLRWMTVCIILSRQPLGIPKVDYVWIFYSKNARGLPSTSKLDIILFLQFQLKINQKTKKLIR